MQTGNDVIWEQIRALEIMARSEEPTPMESVSIRMDIARMAVMLSDDDLGFRGSTIGTIENEPNCSVEVEQGARDTGLRVKAVKVYFPFGKNPEEVSLYISNVIQAVRKGLEAAG